MEIKSYFANSHARRGFMLLMLVAFSSIILGLSVTFYIYCTRGMEISRDAVQLANQRLALRAAINYLTQLTAHHLAGTDAYWAYNARGTDYQYNGAGVNKIRVVDLTSATPLGDNAGWYRIFNPVSDADRVYVTFGAGASNGRTCLPFNDMSDVPPGWTAAKWASEKRAWIYPWLRASTKRNAQATWTQIVTSATERPIRALSKGGMPAANADPTKPTW